MKTEIATRWADALESGRYRKGSRNLHRTWGDGTDVDHDEFCCLGVLCLLAEQDGVKIDKKVVKISERHGSRVEYQGEKGQLPAHVQHWAGMRSTNGTLPAEASDDLTQMNDRNEVFDPVVSAIRRHMEYL